MAAVLDDLRMLAEFESGWEEVASALWEAKEAAIKASANSSIEGTLFT
jgi:hypothetical protein